MPSTPIPLDNTLIARAQALAPDGFPDETISHLLDFAIALAEKIGIEQLDRLSQIEGREDAGRK